MRNKYSNLYPLIMTNRYWLKSEITTPRFSVGVRNDRRTTAKFFGVIEGFYRKPYTFSQRCDLIKFLAEIGLNTYVYAPKSDSYHRKEYNKLYPSARLKEFEVLNSLSTKYKICFNYALAPGVKPKIEYIIKKIEQLLKIGITNFSLLYDDIKIPLSAKSAEIQVETVNRLFEFLRDKSSASTLFLCPTQYCGFDKTRYILTIREKLDKEIPIFWTGRSVVSKIITEEDVDKITRIFNRPPLIWDNIFANDYIPGIILKFPYRNRESGIVEKVSGILINPMNQYQKSKPLIYTAAKFFSDPFNYQPKRAWQVAIRAK